MQHTMRYRLALDLGTTSIGWAMVRLGTNNEPTAVIRTGVRIFSDGRNPKDKASLAVTRREARAARRRRDRLLKRKHRMMRTLIGHGFFPANEPARKALETLDPYELRARGLDAALSPAEFARALFHINQRRGFKSNRKTDKAADDSGALKSAIRQLQQALVAEGCRTVGEWLHRRKLAGQSVRARFHEQRIIQADGKAKLSKWYDLYIDRAMVEAEFDALWSMQARLNPLQFTEAARLALKDVLLFQRPLKPVMPGRCTLIPDEPRAPLALPSTQRARILQEANHLRIVDAHLHEMPLTLAQRDIVVDTLERSAKCSFDRLRRLLKLPVGSTFNLEDVKRAELKGNTTASVMAKAQHFGDAWHQMSLQQQDAIVQRLLQEESEATLVDWLQQATGIDEARAEAIAAATLPAGYGSLSAAALGLIVPKLKEAVVSYAEAVRRAGEAGAPFSHHSAISHAQQTGEVMPQLPYYGEALTRHVGFADPGANDSDPPEKRFGRIANPTVHIGLNQVRVVVNALIKRYGHPAEVIVEVARDLKQSADQRAEENRRQAERQKKNAHWRNEIATVLQVAPERVTREDLQKMQLWEELHPDPLERRCPYSGTAISLRMLFSDEVEVEHILPFSRTLDDSLNNKTVALRLANRAKGNRTPWEAFGETPVGGFDYDAILLRAQAMARAKRYRFAPDGYARWLAEDKTFLARALNDTRYLSRVAHEYLSLICPGNTRVIPGQMTAMLRARFGLNDVLGVSGEKNRDDHRHHAVDACVIGVTDQGLLQRFASASAQARERGLNRLVEQMPLPWPTYREHVQRAVAAIWVSHRPDHGYQGAMHNDTAYGLLPEGRVRYRKEVDGQKQRVEEALKVIPMAAAKAAARHGVQDDGSPKPYKGYKGDSNDCIEITLNEQGKWTGSVVSTFDAYQIVRKHGIARLRDNTVDSQGRPLVMRLMRNDAVRLEIGGRQRVMRVTTISGNGQVFLADLHEANTDARNRDKSSDFALVSKMAGSLFAARARRVTVSPIGELIDPGFKG